MNAIMAVVYAFFLLPILNTVAGMLRWNRAPDDSWQKKISEYLFWIMFVVFILAWVVAAFIILRVVVDGYTLELR